MQLSEDRPSFTLAQQSPTSERRGPSVHAYSGHPTQQSESTSSVTISSEPTLEMPGETPIKGSQAFAYGPPADC